MPHCGRLSASSTSYLTRTHWLTYAVTTNDKMLNTCLGRTQLKCPRAITTMTKMKTAVTRPDLMSSKVSVCLRLGVESSSWTSTVTKIAMKINVTTEKMLQGQ